MENSEQLYQTLYHLMFNAATDALSALENNRSGLAADLLIDAQQRAEELYLQVQPQYSAE